MADRTDTRTDPLPEHVTLPLLTLVTEQSLDQDYAHVAARRGTTQAGPTERRSSLITVIGVLVVFGLLVGTAAAQNSRNAEVDETSRAALIEQIASRREAQARVQDRIGRLLAGNALLEQRVAESGQLQADTDAELAGLQTETGYGSTVGPGIRVRVADPPDAAPQDAVRDSDLAMLADALWGVGAEAISVNGQRLTVRSGFRNVGPAIHVNGVPLSPPYILDAIGDPRSLQSDFVDSARGQEFRTLADTFGFGFEMDNRESLVLPAATRPDLRWAVRGSEVDNEPARPEGGSDDDDTEGDSE
jgi:uncharacterized protein YlxW (UPF0749 family)